MQSIILLLGLFADAISASPLAEQQPLADRLGPVEAPTAQVLAEGSGKPVRGRFLHITGIYMLLPQ
jgi:endopolyphosphatase